MQNRCQRQPKPYWLRLRLCLNASAPQTVHRGGLAIQQTHIERHHACMAMGSTHGVMTNHSPQLNDQKHVLIPSLMVCSESSNHRRCVTCKWGMPSLLSLLVRSTFVGAYQFYLESSRTLGIASHMGHNGVRRRLGSLPPNQPSFGRTGMLQGRANASVCVRKFIGSVELATTCKPTLTCCWVHYSPTEHCRQWLGPSNTCGCHAHSLTTSIGTIGQPHQRHTHMRMHLCARVCVCLCLCVFIVPMNDYFNYPGPPTIWA
jgi:hypothetical protein